jgi:hypothetical protein
MMVTGCVVLMLGQVVLGRAVVPPMPSPEAVAAYGLKAFSPHQESELYDHFADYDGLLAEALTPGRGLPEDVVAFYRDHAPSRGPLAHALRGWVADDLPAPAPRDGVRYWGPPAVVDSLVREDRARAAGWLADLSAEPETPPAPPDSLRPPGFAAEPCSGPGAVAAADGHGRIVGVARSVDGLLVEKCGVYLPALSAVVMTDAAGRFEFCDVPAGAQELKASHIAHRDVAATVPVRDGEVTRIELLLYAPVE